VSVFGNEKQYHGSRKLSGSAPMVVECENVLLLPLGKTIKVLIFSKKEE
jgi:hypothetical protein